MSFQPIEYSGATGLTDDQLRIKLRNAPQNVRRAIDAKREKRGQPPLFGTERPDTRSTLAPARPSATKAKPEPRIVRTLIGAAAPGLSSPCRIRGMGEKLPEHISIRAWEGVVQQLERGQACHVTINHEGGALVTTTDSPRFRYRIDRTVGLVVEIDIRGIDPIVPDGSGLSIGFEPVDYRSDTIGGQRVRIIEKMILRHIAVIVPSSGSSPAYPLAKLRAAKPGAVGKAMLDLRIDTGLAMRKQNEQLVERLRR